MTEQPFARDAFVIPNFTTEGGAELPLTVAYTMYGALNERKDNAVCIVHPFTATPDPRAWWGELVGSGKIFDPARYCIICINVPGSPYGSTHPLDNNPATGFPYYYDFPRLTPRDVVRAFDMLLRSLGIATIRIAVGCSMGGQITFQWLSSGNIPIRRAIIIASDPKITPWMLASHHVQRNALYADATWGQRNPGAGKAGMKIARQIGFLSYRSPIILQLFHTLNMESNPADEAGFLVEQQLRDENHKAQTLRSYLEYQGEKFLQRFNAFSYQALLDLMDSHDISVGHSSMSSALGAIDADVLLIGVDSDMLFPSSQVRGIVRQMRHASYKEISSVYGHDAFLIEYKQLEDIIMDYLYQVDEYYLVRSES